MRPQRAQWTAQRESRPAVAKAKSAVQQQTAIDIKIDRVRVKPFGLHAYDYLVGDLAVSYRQPRVSLHIPGHGERTYEIHGLLPNFAYAVSTGQKITTDPSGTAVFDGPAGQTVILKQL